MPPRGAAGGWGGAAGKYRDHDAYDQLGVQLVQLDISFVKELKMVRSARCAVVFGVCVCAIARAELSLQRPRDLG